MATPAVGDHLRPLRLERGLVRDRRGGGLGAGRELVDTSAFFSKATGSASRCRPSWNRRETDFQLARGAACKSSRCVEGSNGEPAELRRAPPGLLLPREYDLRGTDGVVEGDRVPIQPTILQCNVRADSITLGSRATETNIKALSRRRETSDDLSRSFCRRENLNDEQTGPVACCGARARERNNGPGSATSSLVKLSPAVSSGRLMDVSVSCLQAGQDHLYTSKRSRNDVASSGSSHLSRLPAPTQARK